VFRPNKTLKKARIKLCNTLTLPTLLYGSENWTIKTRDATRITAADMNFMKVTERYTLIDHKTNAEIAKELNVTPVLDTIQDNEKKWIQHVSRMPRNRLPRLIKVVHPNKQKEPRKTTEETSVCVRPERVNEWPNFLTATS
jgi:hypothetical protein